MTLSDFHHITDELLSAYIDGEVTEQERSLIEAAVAQDERIAWRLDSLRQTVTLLRNMPEIAVPRSFALTLEQAHAIRPVPDTHMARTPQRPTHAPHDEAGLWARIAEGWRDFWQAGNPILRNAAAVSFALMLLLTGGAPLLTRALTQPAGTMATMSSGAAPEAAPAAAIPAAEAPAEAVALAPTATAVMAAQEESAANKVAESTADTSTADIGAADSEADDGDAAASSVAQDAAASNGATEAEAPASDVASAAPAPAGEGPAGESPAAAAAIGAPETQPNADIEPPLAAMQPPIPGAVGGSGGDGIGSGGGGGVTGSLVPEQAYSFDVDPLPPAEEAASASIAVAPAANAAEGETGGGSAEAVAVMEGTPAVEAPVAESAVARSAAPAAGETTGEAPEEADEVADEEAAAGEAALEPEATDLPAASATPAVTADEAAALTSETTSETPGAAATTAPTATPETVALVGPEPITHSEVVQNVPTEGAVAVTSPDANLPVLWIAQGSTLLLTVLLASLWWRSRAPRRPRA